MKRQSADATTRVTRIENSDDLFKQITHTCADLRLLVIKEADKLTMCWNDRADHVVLD